MTRDRRLVAAILTAAILPPLGALVQLRNAERASAPAPAPARQASPARQRLAPQPILDRARGSGLLVERVAAGADGGVDVIVSGGEARLLGFADPLALASWRMSALEGGAVRLTAHAAPRIGAPSTRPAPAPTRTLFGTAAPIAAARDAPALAGIVGRLPADAVALVRGEDGRAVTVAPGQDAPGGWRLETLSADAAIFTRAGERARVPLPQD